MNQALPYNRNQASEENRAANKYGFVERDEAETARLIAQIRRLIWLYFGLIIFEGALRKWVVPSLANPLLLARDPVVMAIYYYAIRLRLFAKSNILLFGSVLAWFCLAAGFLALQDSSALQTIAIVLYGFHANFLHLPLIIVMSRILQPEDIKKIGFWVLVLSIPLALIMAMQYSSPGTAWINAGAGEDAKQIAFAGTHVRASATFSFVTGPVLFFSLASAFLIYGFFTGKQYSKWLAIGATSAVGLASVTAGSRSLIGSVGIVAAFALMIGVLLVPRLSFKTIQLACAIGLVALTLSQVPLVQDAYQRMSERVENANKTEGKGSVSGVLNVRVLSGFLDPIESFFEAPLWGTGLGSGTVVGAVVLSGTKSMYLYGNAEEELVRNVLESGPLLGAAFIVFRWTIAFALLKLAWQSTQRGETLPLLLFAVCGPAFVNGNLGQSTVTGFAVFVAGLSLALSLNSFVSSNVSQDIKSA